MVVFEQVAQSICREAVKLLLLPGVQNVIRIVESFLGLFRTFFKIYRTLLVVWQVLIFTYFYARRASFSVLFSFS